MAKIWLFVMAILCLFACGAPDKDTQSPVQSVDLQPGVSLDLAKARAGSISDLNYALTFKVPAEAGSPIDATLTLTFRFTRAGTDLQLDFRETSEKLKTLQINGTSVAVDHHDEHLILPASQLRAGRNTVVIAFTAGDTSLNRNPDYLYTLFVPDRARTAFPVFDQPDLKATYDLVLDLPEDWTALGNGPLRETSRAEDGRRVHRFERSDLLSSYLFSFVAGAFETITRTVDGRQMTMLHRETDPEKLARNVDDIFKAHGDALAWLEDYTGIKYPFQKFDFVLIPTFQYGGMEHVGAIQYRASSLLLDEAPSDPQRLNRANLIAHETAHMWFGDLVTMEWFNDVWTKEVFANFMAAKIVNPSFPEIDHDLNFLLRSYPAAYAVDRTSGANPIRQDLPNLNEAGTLYGGIIYNKAPIMMRQLELLLGEAAFRDGMRAYLTAYAGGNATWPDLIEILDEHSAQDLKAWSDVWVNTPGRPHFDVLQDGSMLQQTDPAGIGRVWPQQLTIAYNGRQQVMDFMASAPALALPTEADILFNDDGSGYGLFPVDLDLINENWGWMTDLQKGAQLINLYEQMLEGHAGVTPAAHFQFLQERLSEPNELLLNTVLGQIRSLYGSFLSEPERADRIRLLEQILWRETLATQMPVSTRKLYFQTLQNISSDPDSLARLLLVLEGEADIVGISLSARERSDLAALLAIKLPEQAEELLAKHVTWLQNPDEKRRFEFLMPALSPDMDVRDAFFASLLSADNRSIESWVVDALDYLHHPERITSSERYIRDSLDILEEIQVTGDIFFPASWMNGTLQNHRSPEAARTVRTFLEERPGYNHQLKLKILQAADGLYRAEKRLTEAP